MWASVALSGLPLFVMWLEIYLYRWIQGLTGVPLSGFCNWAVLLPIATFALMGFQLLLFQSGLEIDWFVQGEQKGVAFFLMAGAIWAAFDLGRWYSGLQRILDESGGGDVPLSLLDMRGWNVWGRNLISVKANLGKSEGRALRLYDARMEKLIEQQLRQGKKPLSSQRRWQVSGVVATMDWLKNIMAGILLIDFALIWVLPAEWSQYANFAAYGGFQLLGSGLLMPLLFTWQRRPMLAMELLRPQTRQDWVMSCFQGVARDLGPVIAASVVYGTWKLWSGTLGDWSTSATLNLIAIVFGILFLIYATGMWALALRSTGTMALVAALGWIVILLCIVIPILLRISPADMETSVLLMSMLVGLYSISAIMARLAFQGWMNWELGRDS